MSLEEIDFDTIEQEMEIERDLHEFDENDEIEAILNQYINDEEFAIEHEEDDIINMILED